MSKKVIVGVVFCLLISQLSMSQPAGSPEEAGVTPVTGDLTPWRAFGLDGLNFDQVWVIALNNGSIVALKRAQKPDGPGVIGGTEFLIFNPDGTVLTPVPVIGHFDGSGNPYKLADVGATGIAWGAFTNGAAADKANGNGFVVHNQGGGAQTHSMPFADQVGDAPHSLVQVFNNDGTPSGSTINAFGDLTVVPDGYRDIGALILSNGDIVSLGENRQTTDDFLDSIGAFSAQVAMAIILAPDGSVRQGPFAPHTDADGNYLGDSSSVVFQNMTAFEGGFVIDYGLGIRWYNNDGTPRTPVQPDHAELEGEVIGEYYFLSSNSGGRGDSMCLASNGKDVIVKSIKVEAAGESVGALIYYNTDGTVRNYVRFDDVNVDDEVPAVDRTFCDVDENGNVFVVWEDLRFGGAEHSQTFGRFFDAAGVPAGPSFPIYENWRTEPEFMNYGGGIGNVGIGDREQPRCALNNQVAAVFTANIIAGEISSTGKTLANAFQTILSEPTLRIFENPFADTDVQEWSVF